ncbi:zeaxanthin epoxidase [Ketogulonicigenium robustum]|uniref:FAD-dependent urate hydroxylase n=1 Tax=Ketogulonicigenium robustum TaxID=92947 RepID=A0A1W6P0Y7_9RHOB|nr:FAD-dependent urate hydroxylase HpxO [Ketogulonicigenium robustum]ARO15073.1 zeaxanthin epoxidase [Ketogulonicigenium robustum]
MKAIIIGAGMGGLCAGIALRRIGHNVEIYERVRDIRPVGAALSLWSNGVKCLNYLGLEQQVRALGGQMDSMAYLEGHSGQTMTAFDLSPVYNTAGQRAYPVARAELQSMLMDEFGRDNIHLGRAVTEVWQEGDTVFARFADGEIVSGDYLIGADGAHSIIRSHVLGEVLPRDYAGYVNFNGLVAIDETIAPADRWTTFVAEGKRASVMPVSEGRFYFFFDVPMPAGVAMDRSAYKDELRQQFAKFAPPVQRLIDAIEPERTNRVEIFDITPFNTWTKGRIALLGDAAHNTSPDIGQGGCMAMEDAVALAISLQTNTLGVEDALVRYQNRRAPRAGEWVLRARRRAAETHGFDMAVTQQWYDGLWKEDGSRIMKGLLSNIEGGPLD